LDSLAHLFEDANVLLHEVLPLHTLLPGERSEEDGAVWGYDVDTLDNLESRVSMWFEIIEIII
jgi:hypothetical protein